MADIEVIWGGAKRNIFRAGAGQDKSAGELICPSGRLRHDLPWRGRHIIAGRRLTKCSVALPLKFEHGSGVRGIGRAPLHLGNEGQGRLRMLKFYFNGSPNPTKVALFLEEAGVPISRCPSTPAPATSSSRNTSTSIRTARCPRSTTTASRCSTATPSCSTWRRRPANSCRRTRRPIAPNCCRG